MPLHCGAFCGQYRPFSTELEFAVKIRRKGRRQPTKTLEAVTWPSAHTLERVRHLNETCLRQVATAVANDESCTIKVVSRYRDLWRRMDDQACKRAAHIPVLLLDLSFESGEWWHWIVRDGPRPVRTPDTSGLLPIKGGAPLLREILVEACVIARSDHPRAARLVFGMSAGALAVIADLPASQIDSISLTHACDLQLRWAHNLIFWKNLLSAAVDGDETEMAAVRLHSLQLLGSNS